MNHAQLEFKDSKLLVSGTLTFDTVNKLLDDSQSWLKKVSNIDIDLSGVTHSDSAGLALLIEWHRYAKQNKKEIIFKNPPVQLLNIAKLSGIDEILPLSGIRSQESGVSLR